MRTRAAAVLLLAPVLAVAEPAPGTPWPAGPLQRESVKLSVLLVHVDPASAEKAPAALARLAPKLMPGVQVVRVTQDQRPQPGKLSWTRGEDAWSEEELQYFARRVDPAVRARLTTRHPVTILAVDGPAADARTLRAFTALAGALAAELDAVVYDLDTRDLWDAKSWAAERVGGFAGALPVVDHHLTIHSYEAGGGVRSVTLGMAKLGLPDVVIAAGKARSADVELLVHAVCQWMAERRALETAGRIRLDLHQLQATPLRDRLLARAGHGAVGAAEVIVAVGRQAEGDPNNPLLEVTFAGLPGGPAERQVALLDRLFGAERVEAPRAGK